MMSEIIIPNQSEIVEALKITRYQLSYARVAGFTTDNEPHSGMIVDAASCSDGHHTFDELYEHRNLLFVIALCGVQWFNNVSDNPIIIWKSKLHDDETMYDGWFIAGMYRRDGKYPDKDTEISYHLPLSLWNILKCPEWKKAPPYTGYTSNDVLDRLRKYYL
jgi:hypothetical protein